MTTGFGLLPEDARAHAEAETARHLEGVYPPLSARAQALIAQAAEAGIRLCITAGFRSPEAQQKLYAQGRTAPGPIVTRSPAGLSWHNYGLAFDVAVLDARGEPSWPEDEALWQRIGEIGEDLDLQWGGRFRTVPDRPHFQMTLGLSVVALRDGDQVVPSPPPVPAHAAT